MVPRGRARTRERARERPIKRPVPHRARQGRGRDDDAGRQTHRRARWNQQREGIRGAVARCVPRAVRSRHAVRRPRSRRSSSRHRLRGHGKHAWGGPGGGVQETRGGPKRVPAGAERYNAGGCGRSEALPVSARRIVAVGAERRRPRRLANVDAKFNRSGGERRGLYPSRERRARAGERPSGCVDAARRDQARGAGGYRTGYRRVVAQGRVPLRRGRRAAQGVRRRVGEHVVAPVHGQARQVSERRDHRQQERFEEPAQVVLGPEHGSDRQARGRRGVRKVRFFRVFSYAQFDTDVVVHSQGFDRVADETSRGPVHGTSRLRGRRRSVQAARRGLQGGQGVAAAGRRAGKPRSRAGDVDDDAAVVRGGTAASRGAARGGGGAGVRRGMPRARVGAPVGARTTTARVIIRAIARRIDPRDGSCEVGHESGFGTRRFPRVVRGA